MPKLTDTQLMLLSKATQQDGLVVIPPKLKGAAATKVIKPLMARGLVNEVPSKPDTAWRRDEAEGQSYALMVTPAGRAAINAEEPGQQPEPKPARKSKRAAKPAGRKSTKSASAAGPRAGSKLAQVIKLLSAARGATLDALVKATDWLPHTTRAALTGLRKRGYEIEKERHEGGRTTYRIVRGPIVRKASTKKRRKG
jgi:hypothetical protein